MDETVEWLRNRPYHTTQMVAHHIMEGQSATVSTVDIVDPLQSALAERGISNPYAHQARAIKRIRNGENVVLATPTASGKSFAYLVPSLETAIDSGLNTLYVAPQVALINDQEETFRNVSSDIDALPDGYGTVAQYSGRTPTEERPGIRNQQPNVVLTTPDMVHCGILPYAYDLWDWFVADLEYVVLDEVHVYRGVLGSHVGLVMRRLNRICEQLGADPQFICCSATIGNPIEHAATVTGQSTQSYSLINEDTSATGDRHWLLWDPLSEESTEERPDEYEEDPDKPDANLDQRGTRHRESLRLFADLVTRGLQTVVFTTARQTAERYAAESESELRQRGHHDVARAITAYHGALNSSRRSTIEEGLNDGSVRGVWSTNALELGVDIGGLDAVILDGYPGTRMQTNQRAGRAGRGDDPCLIVLVGGVDQLDQYVMANPDALFDKEPEKAVADPGNDRLLPEHILCAAAESPLTIEDEHWFGPDLGDIVSDLQDQGMLRRRESADGMQWSEEVDSPAYGLSLRSIEDREIRLYDRLSVPKANEGDDDHVGTLQFSDGLRDAHPGAIYYHQGTKYEVVELDLDADVALMESTQAEYYTQALYEKEIEIEEAHRTKPLAAADDVTVGFADVTVTTQITEYERRYGENDEPAAVIELDLPETTLETKALYLAFPERYDDHLRREATGRSDESIESSISGAYHATVHAMQAMFPTDLLCDRRDVGKASFYEIGPTSKSTLFLYDKHPGGVGLADGGYERIESLLERTRDVISACHCQTGCPSCVQAPHCGRANEGLEKNLAAELLELLTL